MPGDGNCLFRALSDQLWGFPNGHLKLRAEICDWMESQRERYEGFVDEDRTFDTHLRLMRIPGSKHLLFKVRPSGFIDKAISPVCRYLRRSSRIERICAFEASERQGYSTGLDIYH